MKRCNKCDETKSVTEFAKNSSRRDGLQVYCKLCVKEINAAYYKKTPEKNPARTARKAIQREHNQNFIFDYLSKHPCVDCGESDPVVLEFDHIGKKTRNISQLVLDSYSIEKIEAEIEQCEVRCANCHRRVTAKRGNWWKHSRLAEQA